MLDQVARILDRTRFGACLAPTPKRPSGDSTSVRSATLIVALILAGCASLPRTPRWEPVKTSLARVSFEIDRNSVARDGGFSTILVRTSYFEGSQAGTPLVPYLHFDTPYRFSCRDRTYMLLASRSYTAATGKWRSWPGSDEPRSIDLGTQSNWQPDLHATQLRAYEIACAPPPKPKPRPGNRL